MTESAVRAGQLLDLAAPRPGEGVLDVAGGAGAGSPRRGPAVAAGARAGAPFTDAGFTTATPAAMAACRDECGDAYHHDG